MRPVAQLSRAPHFGGGDEHPSRAPHFGGGDAHPAALVFSLEKEFLFQRRRRATCRAARPAPKQSSLVFRVVVTCNRPIYLCSCVQKKQVSNNQCLSILLLQRLWTSLIVLTQQIVCRHLGSSSCCSSSRLSRLLGNMATGPANGSSGAQPARLQLAELNGRSAPLGSWEVSVFHPRLEKYQYFLLRCRKFCLRFLLS